MLPVEKFDSYEQAVDCLEYWKSVLSLCEWIIGLEFTAEEVDPPNWGYSSNFKAIRIAKIYIPIPINLDDFPAKYIAELIIVHELLHIKMLAPESKDQTVRDEWHAILESLAKGYIMARYNVPFEYFENEVT